MQCQGEHLAEGTRKHGLTVVLTIATVYAGVATLVGEHAGVGAAELQRQRPPFDGGAGTATAPANGLRATAARSAALAQTPAEIRGFVTSPVVTTYNPGNPTTFRFTFKGAVNADPDEWFIAVDALNPADADPTDELNWVYNVATFRATGGGPKLFTFAVDGIAPFRSLPDGWRRGGLGRVRVVATMDADPNQWAPLRVRDTNGITPANPFTIVLADAAPDPTKPPGQTDQSIRDPFNPATPNYLSANSGVEFLPPTDPAAEEMRLAEQIALTTAYYDQVQTDPEGIGPDQSIEDTLPSVRQFIDHYFRRSFETGCSPGDNEPEQVAKYFNRGDLGIGREMHCINRGCTGELACYVRNFAAIGSDGKPIFDDKAQAERALRNHRPFATVAMVERQRMAPAAANRVFFVVYDDRGALAYVAQLDNKGFNTSIPGNCLQCHGINSTYRPISDGIHEVKNAFFLPFDLNAFEFFSDEPHDRLSRADQEPAFRAFNRMVRFHSLVQFSSEASKLIEGWYGGDLHGGIFNGGFVQEGWRQGDRKTRLAHGQLYGKLHAVACRTCHISYIDPVNDPTKPPPPNLLAFGQASAFIGLARGVMCRSSDMQSPGEAHRMPAAEQTLKVLWRSEGRPHLFAQVPGAFGDCGL